MRRRAAIGRPATSHGTGRFALVVLVDDVGPVVDECRRRFDPAAAVGMPPHVTVLYPLERYGQAEHDALSEVVGAHRPFTFELAAPGRFPGVVYLSPRPAEPFVELTEAVSRRLGMAPYGGQFDGIIPHLTIAARRRLPRRTRRLVAATLPVTVDVRRLDVLVEEGGRWRVVDSLPLGGGSSGPPPAG